MAIIQTPQPGQLLDIGYISAMAKAINDLSAEVNISPNKYLTVDTENNGEQSIKTADAKVVGKYEDLINDTSVNAGEVKTITVDFGVGFEYTPIVTATPKLIKDTPAGKDVSILIQQSSRSKAVISIKFNTSGNASIGVNVLAVGIPATEG